MEFDGIINNILKEDENSKVDRINALRKLKVEDSTIYVTGYFTDDSQPGVDLIYRDRPFSIWWMFDDDALKAIEDVENGNGTAEQNNMVGVLREILETLIASSDPDAEELTDIKHNGIFGFIDVGHYYNF
jgi:hypothetical protein